MKRTLENITENVYVKKHKILESNREVQLLEIPRDILFEIIEYRYW